MNLLLTLQLIEQYKYLLLFIGSFIEGFNIMFIGGFMASMGTVDVFSSILVLFLGDFLSDIMWYYIGYFGGEKALHWISGYYKFIYLHVDWVKKLLNENAGKILITIKTTSGLCIATILASGLTRINIKKFLFYDFIGSVLWVSLAVLIGYFSGSSYIWASQYYKFAGAIILALIICSVVFLNYLNKRNNFQNGQSKK